MNRDTDDENKNDGTHLSNIIKEQSTKSVSLSIDEVKPGNVKSKIDSLQNEKTGTGNIGTLPIPMKRTLRRASPQQHTNLAKPQGTRGLLDVTANDSEIPLSAGRSIVKGLQQTNKGFLPVIQQLKRQQQQHDNNHDKSANKTSHDMKDSLFVSDSSFVDSKNASQEGSEPKDYLQQKKNLEDGKVLINRIILKRPSQTYKHIEDSFSALDRPSVDSNDESEEDSECESVFPEQASHKENYLEDGTALKKHVISKRPSQIYKLTSEDISDDDENTLQEYTVEKEKYLEEAAVLRKHVTIKRPFQLYKLKPKDISDDEDTAGSEANEQDDRIEKIVEELINTEEHYVSGLKKVVQEYKPFIHEHAPQHLRAKVPHLFGDVEKLWKESQTFLGKLRESRASIGKIVTLFTETRLMFDLYPEYSQNKSSTEKLLDRFKDIVTECKNNVKDELDLRSYLISPIQRLGRYILLLTKIQKEFKKSNKPFDNITSAINYVEMVMRKCNEFLAIDSINCDLDLSLQGPFIMKDIFHILKPRKFTATVFMFENAIIFTQEDSQNEGNLTYVDKIRMDDVGIDKLHEEDLIFHMRDYSRSKEKNNDKLTYTLKANTPAMKNNWLYEIESRLWTQVEKLKINKVNV